MSTPAVTPETSAVPTGTANSDFLPSGKDYRLKGELPAEQKEAVQEETEVKEEQDPSTAEASEASTEEQEQKGPAQSKSEKTSESRWAKLSRENRELRDRLARLEGANEASSETQRETKQESQPAKEAETDRHAEPKIDDVDDKGNAKYSTLSEFHTALAKWAREEAVRDTQEMLAKTEKERAFQQAEQLIEKTVNDRVKAARKAYSDYDEAIESALAEKDEQGRDAMFYTKGSHIDAFFLDSELGQDVMYHIAKNFDDYKHIFARDEAGRYIMNSVRQLRELAKIENSLPDKSKAPVQKVTQAPRPPHQVSGKSAVTKDAVEAAVDEGDSETYIREQNARALARLKRK